MNLLDMWVSVAIERAGWQGADLLQFLCSPSPEKLMEEATSRWRAGDEAGKQQELESLPHTPLIAAAPRERASSEERPRV